MMRKSLILGFFVMLFSMAAHAYVKVAEYGDPIIGNDYNDCEFNKTYGAGGPGYRYDEYTISCPSHGTYVVGVHTQNPSQPYYSPTCTFYPQEDGYFAEGNCENWRVYLTD